MAKAPRICSVEGCGKKHEGRGYCQRHLWRVRHHGDPGGVERLTPVMGTCKHPEGCERKANGGRGWCRMHYHRVREHGDPGSVGPILDRTPAVPTCVAEEDGEVCGKPTKSRGLCSTHARRLQRNGTLVRLRARSLPE